MDNNKLQKKKKVTFSEFNRVYIIPNRDQIKLLEYDPLVLNKKKGRFMISTFEYNSEKT